MSDADTPRRIVSLDIVRGVAVMGIFAMNIVNFAMPDGAYSNPAAYGTDGPADLAAWFAAFVLIDGKMRGLFSVLFGASMLIVVDSAEAAGRSGAAVHYSRMAWLLVFGLLHYVLVWDGDILAHYAIVGAVAVAFRRCRPYQLAAWAASLLMVELLFMGGLSVASIVVQSAAADPGAAARAVSAWQGISSSFAAPATAELTRDLALHRGPMSSLVTHRWDSLQGDLQATLQFFGLETLAYMLAGMWGLKSGFLTGAWPRARYAAVAAWCLGIAIPAYAALAVLFQQSGFRTSWVFGITLGAPVLIRPIMIAGLAALILLATARGGALVTRIAAAGRAAFSNYIGASLIATAIFYGHGFGLYGRLTRWELYPLVFAVWVGMLLWSKPWLDRYRYGAFEWLWRSLSRGAAQPMRRSRARSARTSGWPTASFRSRRGVP